MSVMSEVSELMIREFVQGAIQHLPNKELAKEKAEEFRKYLDFIGEGESYVIAKVNGKVSLAIIKKKNLNFQAKPDFINLESIIDDAIASI